MPTRTFIVEILLRARDEIAGVVNKAAEAVDNLTRAQTDHGKVADQTSEKLRGEITALERMREAHIAEKKAIDDSIGSMREEAAARRAQADAATKSLNELKRLKALESAQASVRERESIKEVTRLRAEAAAREEAIGKIDKQIKAKRREASALQAVAAQEAAANKKQSAALGLQIAERQAATTALERSANASAKSVTANERQSKSLERSISSTTREINKLSKEAEKVQHSERGIRQFFANVRSGAKESDVNLAKLAASFRGFAVAFVIKYAQALLSTLTGLAGALVAVATTAIQAGGALAGSFAAGAAQAIPVIGTLILAMNRLKVIFQALRLQQQNTLTDAHQDAQAKEAQRNATERVRSAEQALADAHRSAADAVKAVTQARRDARRELEDLILAERRAQLQAEGASLSLEEAQARLRQAVATGDASGVGQAQLGVEEAQLGRTEARRGSTRATQDLARRRTEGSPGLAQAEASLAGARRQEVDAAHQLTEARHDASAAALKEAASVDRLASMLKQLSPAERALFDTLTKLQHEYKKAFRPITDIIIESFTRVAERVRVLLGDPQILGGFRRIATSIAGAIDDLTKFAGSKEGRGFFDFITKEASKNIPIVVRIIERLLHVFQNLARAASPALHDLLGVFEDYAKQADKASTPTKKLSDFFRDGVKYFKAWVDLGLAAIDLIGALTGAGAGEGVKTIRDATRALHRMADSVRENRKQVAGFFADARRVTYDVISVLVVIAKEVIRAFSPANVHAFSDFLKAVVIPALGTTIGLMGYLTTAAHAILSLPVVSDVIQWAATFLLLAKALSIVRGALIAMRAIQIGFIATFGLLPALILAVIVALVVLDRRFHFLGPTFKFIARIAVEAFDAIKSAGRAVGRFFEDSWNKGLLRLLRYPFELFYNYFLKYSPFIFIIRHAKDIINFFKGAGSGAWGVISDFLLLPFRVAKTVIKFQFDAIRTAVKVVLDLIRGDIGGAKNGIVGAFKSIANGIAGVWDSILGTTYKIVAVVVNGIISGVNGAISAFNKLPGVPNIGKIDFHMARTLDAARTLSSAKAGEATSNYAGPRAMGGYERSSPGGKLIKVVEGGYDEVVLTTDPKHAKRQQKLLGQYLAAAPHVLGVQGYERGGYVQGAIPPAGHNILALINKAFSRGYNVTDALRPGGRTYHGPPGQAADFGNSVNDMSSVWSWLFPQRKVFAELFGPTAQSHGIGYHYGAAASIAGSDLQKDHEDHIHIAFLDSAIGAARALGKIAGNARDLGSLGLLGRTATSLLGRAPVRGGFASPALRAVYNQASTAIDAMRDRATGSLPTASYKAGDEGGGYVRIASSDLRALAHVYPRHTINDVKGRIRFTADQVMAVARSVGLPGRLFEQIAHGESNYFPGVVQIDPGDGNVGYGLFQDTPNAWGKGSAAYRFMQSLGGISQLLNPVKNAMVAKFLYDHAASKQPNQPGFPWYGTAFVRESGGPIYAKRGTPVAGILHGDEHVWTANEVERAGGHSAMRAMRRMFGGGRQSTGGSYADGGGVLRPIDTIGGSTAISESANTLLEIIATFLSGVTKSKKLASRIRQAFTKITEDGGPLDEMAKEVTAIGTRAALALQRAQFSVVGGRARRTTLTDVEIGRSQLGTLGDQRAGLEREASGVGSALQAARRAATAARKKGDTKAEQQAKAEIVRLSGIQDDVRAQLAQNAQDMVEKQEAIQQSMLDEVNNGATRQQSALDRQQRVATALGQALNPSNVIEQRVNVMQQQIAQLQPVLAAAASTGNASLVQTIQEQIAELETSIAEAGAQMFQARIDAVNDQASRSLSSADLTSRLAQIGGRTNFALQQSALGQRASAYAGQREGLAALLGQASAAGNITQVDALTRQIQELDVTIAENVQALKDNTNAARAQTIQDIQTTSGFAGSVTTGAVSFFQGLRDLTGQDFTSIIGGVLGTQTKAIGAERRGLVGVLSDLLGYSPGEQQGLQNMTPQEIVQYLLSITSGPAFDSIMARLDPTQADQFRGLVQALFANASATTDNTKAIQENTGATTQSFSSTAWTRFREAIFTGSGGLLPQYASLIPRAATGGWISRDGVVYAHAGEEIRPAGEGGGGDTYHLNVTSPTQVLDPAYTAQQLAFFKRTRGR